ncbi:hypothetical protein XENOCAPTIV_012058 [Xenoophorus captivus]|uniref:Uncharacterized protein n=1 Tax=Xenoophorus captivus TaxID=1517983 RepID=A0ABV0Q9I4_9TELE
MPFFYASPPPQHCPWRSGEVMYGASPDRTTQQSRWTEETEGQRCTVVDGTKGALDLMNPSQITANPRTLGVCSNVD